jgi:hypothetical protein
VSGSLEAQQPGAWDLFCERLAVLDWEPPLDAAGFDHSSGQAAPPLAAAVWSLEVTRRLPIRLGTRLGLIARSAGASREQRSRRCYLPDVGAGAKREWAALGVPAHRPPIAGVDDRAAKLADALEGRDQVGNREVGQGRGCRRGPVHASQNI